MSLSSWLSWFPSGLARNPAARTRRQRPPAQRRPGRRLGLEPLEDRTLMSGLSLTAGSVSQLIADINAANSSGLPVALDGSCTYNLTGPAAADPDGYGPVAQLNTAVMDGSLVLSGAMIGLIFVKTFAVRASMPEYPRHCD